MTQYPELFRVRQDRRHSKLQCCIDFCNVFHFGGESKYKFDALGEAAKKFIKFVKKMIDQLAVVKSEASDPKRQIELYIKSAVKRFGKSKSTF